MAHRGNSNNSSQSGLCIFCWTYLTRDITELDCAALANHLISIERYFANWNKIEKTLRIPELVVKKSVLIGACEKCGEIVKGFSKLYQEMKCIELKLNWKLDSLKTIVENVERQNALKLKCTSQKKAHHRAKFKKPRDELLEFQKKFLEKCSSYFKQLYPKLTLKRYYPPEQEAVTKSDDCDERRSGHKISEANLKSPVQKKRRVLNSRSKAKIKKRVPEFRIPELATFEMVNDSAPSIVLYGTQSGLDLVKSANEIVPEKTSETVNLQNNTATATNTTSNCENDSHTNMELAGSTSGTPINIINIAESIIKHVMLEETETTKTRAFQGDQATSSATTCEHVSTPNLKFEEQPIFFDDDDQYNHDTMSIDDETDPLADGKNNYDDDIESKNEARNKTPSRANDSPCDKEISISGTFLLKRDEPGNTTTTPLIETEIEITSSSLPAVKAPLKFSAFVSNDSNDALKKIDAVTENTKNSSDESPLTAMPENESVSRFRRRFKCSQCTLTFTSEGSLENHSISAHMQIEDLNDKDHVDGQSESELEIDDDDEDGEHDDRMTSESDSNYDIIEEGETDEEFVEKPLKSEVESSDDETEIEASKSVKAKCIRRKNKYSESVRDWNCGKCEPWSKESKVHWRVHLVNHRYLHTNGQEALTDKNPEHLNIKWSDLKVEIGGNVVELKEEFTAPGCGRKFALKEHFDYHLRLHGSYTCANTNCETTTCCFMDLVKHETIHSNKRRTKNITWTSCSRCNFQTKKSENIFRHYLRAHFGDIIDTRADERNYCRICKFSFGKVSGCFPMTHFLNYHDLYRIDDPSKVHRCDVKDCPAYFLTLKQLEAHQQIFHLKTAKAPSTTKNYKRRQGRPNKIILENMRKAKITEDGLTVEDFVLRKGAEFKCDETSCNNAAFFTEEEMNIHRKLHGNFKCNFCEAVENYAPNLCIHELEVHSKTADDSDAKDAYYIQCPRICPKKISGRPRYIAHHLREHLGLESDTPRCLICGFLYFLENKSLEAKIFTHFRDHHDLSSLDTTGDDTVWRCTKENCKAYFLSRFQLSNHVQLMHCVKKKIRRMPCLECDKILKSQKLFSQHMLKCHPEAFYKFFPFPCHVDGCLRRCETEETLRRHLYMSHPKQSNQHMCQVCGKYSKNAWSLTQHLKLHDEEFQKRVQETRRKNGMCDQCGSIFKSKNVLEKHKLCHSGPESWTFVCEICSKKCLTKQKLQEHLRTHTKEKPFQCDHCGASYAHRHNWRMHVQKNHGVEIVPTKVYKKVNERMKAKYVKKVGDANGQGTSSSLRKRRMPKRRKDWEEEEESSVGESDSSDSD